MKQSKEMYEFLKWFDNTAYSKGFINSDEKVTEVLGTQLAFDLSQELPIIVNNEKIKQLTFLIQTILGNGLPKLMGQTELMVQNFCDIYNLTNYGIDYKYTSGDDFSPMPKNLEIKGEARDGSFYGVLTNEGRNQLNDLIGYAVEVINSGSVAILKNPLQPTIVSDIKNNPCEPSVILQGNKHISLSVSILREDKDSQPYLHWTVQLDTIDVYSELPEIAQFYLILVSIISEYISRQTVSVKILINNAYTTGSNKMNYDFYALGDYYSEYEITLKEHLYKFEAEDFNLTKAVEEPKIHDLPF